MYTVMYIQAGERGKTNSYSDHSYSMSKWMYMQPSPEFDLVQHAFGLLVGHTYQGLFVNGNELIPGSQTSILHNKETVRGSLFMLSSKPYRCRVFL